MTMIKVLGPHLNQVTFKPGLRIVAKEAQLVGKEEKGEGVSV